MLPDVLEIFLGQDVTGAIRRAAAAGMLPVIVQIITVVERDFRPGPDAASRHNPDAPAVRFRLAIRVATVIQKTRRVPWHVAVEVVGVIQRENVFVGRFAPAQRFSLGDLFADVFDDARASGDVRLRKPADAMNGGWLKIN